MAGLTKLYFGWSAYLNAPWQTLVLPKVFAEVYVDDHIKLLSARIEPEKVMMILEAESDHSPQWITGRLNGRLNHFLKKKHPDFPGFDRSFFFQSL